MLGGSRLRFEDLTVGGPNRLRPLHGASLHVPGRRPLLLRHLLRHGLEASIARVLASIPLASSESEDRSVVRARRDVGCGIEAEIALSPASEVRRVLHVVDHGLRPAIALVRAVSEGLHVDLLEAAAEIRGGFDAFGVLGHAAREVGGKITCTLHVIGCLEERLLQ